MVSTEKSVILTDVISRTNVAGFVGVSSLFLLQLITRKIKNKGSSNFIFKGVSVKKSERDSRAKVHKISREPKPVSNFFI